MLVAIIIRGGGMSFQELGDVSSVKSCKLLRDNEDQETTIVFTNL